MRRLSLDLRKKELTQQKEELLKESKSKLSTMDSVKSQIDMLMKVGTQCMLSLWYYLTVKETTRLLPKFRRKSMNSSYPHIQTLNTHW